jgi:nitroreductase
MVVALARLHRRQGRRVRVFKCGPDFLAPQIHAVASDSACQNIDLTQDCAKVLVVALLDGRDSHVFGRRTMPEMDLASVSCAIQNMWLLARAEGIGIGWVSLVYPDELASLLDMPQGDRWMKCSG